MFGYVLKSVCFSISFDLMNLKACELGSKIQRLLVQQLIVEGQ